MSPSNPEMCILCGRHPARYSCDGGCMDHLDNNKVYCGYCCRMEITVFVQHAMLQRLCAICGLREENPHSNGIYDARFYTVKDIQQYLDRNKEVG